MNYDIFVYLPSPLNGGLYTFKVHSKSYWECIGGIVRVAIRDPTDVCKTLCYHVTVKCYHSPTGFIDDRHVTVPP